MANSRTSSSDSHTRETGTGSPMSRSMSLKAWRSSAFRMVSIPAPSNRTWYRSRTPAEASSVARFNPVWPPRVGSSASGRSRAMTRSTASTVRGSRYTRSATSSSVMIVAGFEFTSTVAMPSSRSALQAWVPA